MDGIQLAPGVVLGPKFLADDGAQGMLARVVGTHSRYGLAREFLDRSGPPWGWSISARGLYEWRRRTDDREGARFFVVEGAFRARVRLVSAEDAYAIVAAMTGGR